MKQETSVDFYNRPAIDADCEKYFGVNILTGVNLNDLREFKEAQKYDVVFLRHGAPGGGEEFDSENLKILVALKECAILQFVSSPPILIENSLAQSEVRKVSQAQYKQLLRELTSRSPGKAL